MKNTFSEYVKPVIVLVLICLSVTSALAFTYGVTKPKIEERAKKDADAARTALLPAADTFDEFKGDLIQLEDGSAEVKDCYTAKNGEGVVVTAETNSFGGALTMMVGVDKSGEITGVVVTKHADTPGVGTKDMTEEYLGQYKGLKELTSDAVKEDGSVDYISGASVTGDAIHKGVVISLSQYHEAMGDGTDDASSASKEKKDGGSK